MRVRAGSLRGAIGVMVAALSACGGGAGNPAQDGGAEESGDGAPAGEGAVGDNNPDGVPEATAILVSADYETEVADDVLNDVGLAVGTWSAATGYGPSGGWRFQPDPIDGTAENEDSAGWPLPQAENVFPPDAYDLVTVSFMMQLSGPLLDEIASDGPFWAHVNKLFDFKYWNATGDGEGGRNGIHFGRNPPTFWLSSGGAGQFEAIGPDWRTLADEWVWICLVVDMRGAAPQERSIAAYYKRAGEPDVTLMGRATEDNAELPLQPYNGRGFWGFFSPLFGYWDDMNGRDTLAGSPSEMAVLVDRVRVANGWPTGADGPPPSGFLSLK